MAKKQKDSRGGNARLTRKDMRKEQRQNKKLNKVANFKDYLSKKKAGKAKRIEKDEAPGKFVLLRNKPRLPVQKIASTKSVGETLRDEIVAEKRKQQIITKEMKKQRSKQLLEDNKTEEKTIKMLEKQLKLNKRKKNQSVPKAFVESGLDYILDVCDSSKIQAAVQAEMNLQDSESEFEDDLAVITGKSSKKKISVKKKSVESAAMENSSEASSDSNYSDIEEELQDSDVEDFDESDDPPEESSAKNLPVKRKIESFSDDGSDDESYSEEDEKKASSRVKRSSDGSFPGSNSKKIKLDDEDSDKGSDEEGLSEDEEENDDEEEESQELHEDIYGRLRDKQGNVVPVVDKKYVPPHMREQPVDDKKKAELDKLTRTIKGLLNRLAENNMHSISNQIDDLYMKHSRFDMNNTLLKQFTDSLISHVLTPERLVMEHAMLLAVLHANVGSEVGAFFLQHLGNKFDEVHQKEAQIENKEMDNLLLLLCHMYTFKMFDCVLLYDILQQLANKFSPKDVDLILVILRTVGFDLRKDNPLALKDFILNVQQLANNAGGMKTDSRVRFMLDVLLSIKNNNVSKIPQYDTSHSEHLKKIIKPMFRKGNYVTQLKITLEELLKADERGKWWVVGSAWSGPSPQDKKTLAPKIATAATAFTQEILDLAKKQRMNTANRKNIFCILMTAEDYLDAFEKLIRLGLKGQPEQDIVHVLIHCLMSEKTYNPYYSHIADQLCLSDRRHRMTIQYSVWDRFKELKNHSNYQVTNLAKFLAHLFIQNSLPLSTLKVLEFTELDKSCLRLLRQLLLALLLHSDQTAMVDVFTRVAKPKRLILFRESLRLFMRHFLLKNIKDENSEEAVKLRESIALAEQALMTFSDT